VVQRLAHELDADLVTLNAQDLAQLLSEQDLAEAGATSTIRSLGYEVHRPPVTASRRSLVPMGYVLKSVHRDSSQLKPAEIPAISHCQIG
jgi:hypothetical protein